MPGDIRGINIQPIPDQALKSLDHEMGLSGPLDGV